MTHAYVPAARMEAARNSMEITVLLQRMRGGDQGALNLLIPLVYDELKKLA